MGLDTTHDCFHGAYSSFGRFRKSLAKAINLELDNMCGFGKTPDPNSVNFILDKKPEVIFWEDIPYDDLHILINHSDCDGVIEHKDCLKLADRMKEIIPQLEEEYKDRAEQFIEGLLLAHDQNEDVEFG